MSQPIEVVLGSWTSLNQALMTMGEDECTKLLEHEKKNQRRAQFMLRIHSRLNKVRAHRERGELKEAARATR